MNKAIPVTRPSMPPLEEYIALLRDIWDTQCLSNYGPLHRQFEQMLKAYLNTQHLGLFSNGHMALELALKALPHPRDGEIITTAYSFCSTVNAIVRNGFTPVFCDIREDNFTIDPMQIEAKITDKTVAIVATHVYGFLCDDARISDIAKRHGLVVVYDAAHAFGVTQNGVSAAQLGDLAMFSTHATKVFHTIEGGILCGKNEDYVQKAVRLANFGLAADGDVLYPGANAKMNELEAAMGICNLRHLDAEISRRKTAADRYFQRLEGLADLRLPGIPPDFCWNYAFFPVLFQKDLATRDRMMERLMQHGITPRKYFAPALHKASCYQDRFGGVCLPVTERVASQILALPMYAELEPEDVDRICDIILCEGGFSQ